MRFAHRVTQRSTESHREIPSLSRLLTKPLWLSVLLCGSLWAA